MYHRARGSDNDSAIKFCRENGSVSFVVSSVGRRGSSVIVRIRRKDLGSPVLNAARMAQLFRVALKSMEKLAAA